MELLPKIIRYFRKYYFKRRNWIKNALKKENIVYNTTEKALQVDFPCFKRYTKKILHEVQHGIKL